ncbi:MAG: hypothetical protein QMD85_03495 [Candidatus Aenigmarchaeota archaeon]|nr:hypothetical protein [Candidatus Aenigmarchaeota archaeon]MDI6722611.1 hypothetical protein [Candidatus Aenigmarchaeota archaeon]
MPARNKLLLHITGMLQGAKPDWEQMVAKFRRTPMYKEENYNLSNLAGKLEEIWLQVTLEDICSPFGDRVVFDPIRNGTLEGNYVFKHYDDGLKAVDRLNGSIYSEIDNLLLIDKMPTLFEIKIKRYDGGPKRATRKPSYASIKYFMREEMINYLLEPLKEYFQTEECGYVLIASADQILKKSPLQQRFEREGGILVPFYTDRYSYRKEVMEIALSYGLLGHLSGRAIIKRHTERAIHL